MHISNTDAMLALGSRLSKKAQTIPSGVIYLKGALGAGKTTFVRGVLRGLGYQGIVKSPTYTLVETYALPALNVYHWDMYRINDPHELENVGIREYEAQPAWWFIEWPEKAQGSLPEPDLIMTFEVQGNEREIIGEAFTEKGEQLCQSWL